MFTQEVADAICEQLSEGKSLRAACRQEGMPSPSTVLEWLEDKNNPGFAEQYACARARGYQLLADEIIEISDESEHDTDDDGRVFPEFVARSRLRVDSRKWMLSKMLPKVYGEKMALTGDGGGPITTETKLNLSGLTKDQLRAISSIAIDAG